jgi:hypothetical protein
MLFSLIFLCGIWLSKASAGFSVLNEGLTPYLTLKEYGLMKLQNIDH